MASPTVRDWGTAKNVTDSLPAFAVTLPTRVAGDLLIAFVAHDSTTGITQSGGTWHGLSYLSGQGASVFAVYTRIATNDANDNLSIAAGNNQDSSCRVISITVGTHGCTTASDFPSGSVAGTWGATGNADSINANPGVSKDWLALSAAAVELSATGSSISAYPSTYAAGFLQKSASSTTSIALGVGYKDLTAASSENPGAFTNTSGAWKAVTILVPPPDTAKTGTASGTIATVTGTGLGEVAKAGTASGALGTVTGTANGVRGRRGTASADLGTVTGTALGTHTHFGAASGDLGTVTGTALGVRGRRGTATGDLGTVTGTALGVRGVRGTASGDLGTVTGTALGQVKVTGTASGDLGTVTGTAVGVITNPNKTGTATGDLGTVTGTALGRVGKVSTATAALGTVTGTALGQVKVSGTASGALGTVTGTAVGQRAVRGTAATTLIGGMNVLALPGLAAWVDSASSPVTYGTGLEVAQINDQSPNASHLYQSLPANRWEHSGSRFGMPTLVAPDNTVTDWMQGAWNGGGSNKWAVFVAFKMKAPASQQYQRIIGFSGGNTNPDWNDANGFAFTEKVATEDVHVYSASAERAASNTNGPLNFDTWQTGIVIFDGSVAHVFIDGVEGAVPTNFSATITPTHWHIGGVYPWGSDGRFTGEWGESVVLKGVDVDATLRQSVDEYLSGKWVAGTGSGTGWTATALGKVSKRGTASASLGTVTGDALGDVAHTGTATGDLGTVTGTALGSKLTYGTASADLGTVTGTVLGLASKVGTATGDLGTVTGTAAGAVRHTGSATGALGTVTGTALGDVDHTGTASGALGTATGTALGKRGVRGTAATTSDWTATALGRRGVRGTASASLGTVTGTAQGRVGHTGTATADLGTVTGTVLGVVGGAKTGVATGDLGTVTGTAVGIAVGDRFGTASSDLGTVTGIGLGQRKVRGTASGALGTATGTAVGRRGVRGALSALLSTLSGTVQGRAGRRGTATGALGTVTGTALGTYNHFVQAGSASSTGAAQDADPSISHGATSGAASGAASAGRGLSSPVVETATAAGDAFNALATTGDISYAEIADGTATAFDGGSSAIVTSGAASATGTAGNAKAGFGLPATTTSASSAALNSDPIVGPAPPSASASASAFNATCIIRGQSLAAAAIVESNNASLNLSTRSSSATASVQALASYPLVGPSPEPGTATAFSGTIWSDVIATGAQTAVSTWTADDAIFMAVVIRRLKMYVGADWESYPLRHFDTNLQSWIEEDLNFYDPWSQTWMSFTE